MPLGEALSLFNTSLHVSPMGSNEAYLEVPMYALLLCACRLL